MEGQNDLLKRTKCHPKKRKENNREFFNNKLIEQETFFSIDYFQKEVIVYSNLKSAIIRLERKIGKPTNITYINNKICSASWIIPFSDKAKINKVLSRPTLIGQRK